MSWGWGRRGEGGGPLAMTCHSLGLMGEALRSIRPKSTSADRESERKSDPRGKDRTIFVACTRLVYGRDAVSS